MKRSLALGLLAGLGTLASAQLARAADYYVAPGGDDGVAGTSVGAPWATLQHAADVVAAGDTVHVAAGNYAGFYLETSGTAGQPIAFLGEPGATIDADSPTTPDGINLEGASYVTVAGFHVVGTGRAGIRAVLCDHVTIRDNVSEQNARWGVLTGFCDNLLIEHNETSYSVAEHGIYVGNSGDNPVIRHNFIHHNNANGIHMNGDVSQGGDGIISGALVEGNVIVDNGVAGGSGINGDGVQDSTIVNNLVYSTHASGISLYQIDGGAPAINNAVVNNTIIVASDGRWCLNIQDGSTGNVAFNNILLNRHASRGSIDISPDSLPGFFSDYNVVMNRLTHDDGTTIQSLAAWQADTGLDAHSLVATEVTVFVDAANDDYHLAPSSPAVDAGTSVGAPATDLVGTARPTGAAVDIGAYEYCVTDCGTGAGGSGGGGQGGSGAAAGSGTGGSGATGTGGTGTGAKGAGDAPGEEGGCGCTLPGGRGRSGLAALAALALLATRRRRHRR